MTPAQRFAARSAAWAGLALAVLYMACASIWRTALFVNTYEVNVNIRTVTEAAAVRGEIGAARAFVRQRLSASSVAFHVTDSEPSLTPEADANGILSGRTIGVETLAYRSLDFDKLAQIPGFLGAKYDLRGDDSGHVDYDAATEIRIVGPVLLFGPTDAAFLIEIALLVVAFGALEVRRSDPLAFPAGMHPVVIFLEISLIGAIGVSLVALRQHDAHPLLPGYVAIFLLANAALVRWLWVSRDKWSGSLRANYWSIVAAVAAVDIVNALTLLPR
jgi:hypothetical protein